LLAAARAGTESGSAGKSSAAKPVRAKSSDNAISQQ
jgi:hypothetical protein